jgi:hypothetical protein
MSSTLATRAALFKEMALLRDIPDEELEQLAGRFLDFSLGRGEQLYEQGERAENFYVVLSGLLRCEQVAPDGNVTVTALEDGDPFGARTLLLDGSLESRIKAVRPAQVLYLPRPDFANLMAKYPQLKERLLLIAAGRKLKTEVEFDWLGKDEIVHFVTRKHSAYLWTRLSRAMAVVIMGLLAITYAVAAPASSQLYWFGGGAALLVAAAALAIWEVLDWRNDYYVLTDQRAVWVENELLRSSGRIEAPLESIQAVNTHTSFTGQLMGYGDIVVRTYTGTVLMPSVGDPQNMKFLIEEYITRLRKGKRLAKHDSIRQAVRESLGTAPQNGAQQRSQSSTRIIERDSWFNFFKTRTVDGDKIIYHKHWFTLISSLVLPALFMLAALYVLRVFYGGLPSDSAGRLLVFAAVIAPTSVMIYRYVDWQNDIYLVTPDSLLDSEKKPLGALTTKSAPLANVLSLENHREGLGLLFNYGVVRIKVGDSVLDFDNVHDPAQVQQDIFARMEALKYKKEQKQSDDERTRMTEWLRVYEEERGRRGQPPAAGSEGQDLASNH